uniref:Uncharacterized protein n=1 Tax=Anguilla anguilla TaxID=7936 RepID=A0A0E9WR94_ANGAN
MLFSLQISNIPRLNTSLYKSNTATACMFCFSMYSTIILTALKMTLFSAAKDNILKCQVSWFRNAMFNVAFNITRNIIIIVLIQRVKERVSLVLIQNVLK